MRKIALVALMLLFSSNVYAACTDAELQQKVQTFVTTAQELSQKDPQRFVAVQEDMQKELPALQAGADQEKVCDFYDRMIAKME